MNESTQEPMQRSRLLIITCYASFLVAGISATLLGPLFPSLTDRYHIPLQDGGIFTFLSFGGATIIAPFLGRIIDHINVRYILAGGMLGIGIGLLMLSVAPTLPIAMLGTLIYGLATGAIILGPNVVMVTLFPKNAAGALNFLNVFFGVGAIIGPQFVNFALSQQHFELALQVSGVLALVLVVPFAATSLFLRADRSAARPKINWPALLPLAVLIFMYVGAEAGFGNWLFTELTRVSLAATATATVSVSVFWLGLTSGRLLAGFLLRFLSNKQIMLGSLVLAALGIVLLISVPGGDVYWLACAFVVGFGCGPVAPNLMALATNIYPEARGTVLGAFNAFGGLGGSLMPWLQGQIGGGKNGGMILPLSLCVVISLGVVFVGQRLTHVHNAESDRSAVA